MSGVFVEKRQPLLGSNTWAMAEDHYDYYQEVANASFADMLHDTDRNRKYEFGIRAAISAVHARGQRARVLDIGAGTGLLSMMAVRHGADTVHCCEMFRPMSDCARRIIERNGMSNRIQLIPKNSKDLTVGEPAGDLPERCNILVTEVFDTELIGEGALPIFRHAHNTLLTADCLVVPHSATVYIQIVDCPTVQNWNRLKDIYDDDGELLVRIPTNVKQCLGSAAVHDIQLSQVDVNSVKTLVPTTAVFQFNWSGGVQELPPNQRSTTKECLVQRTGMAQAVFMWWDLHIDAGNEIILSCAPSWTYHSSDTPTVDQQMIPWRDHWLQAVYYMPKEILLEKGHSVHVVCAHDEYSFSFNVVKHDPHLTGDGNRLEQICTCGVHVALSRNRIGQLNESRRNKRFLAILNHAVINRDSTVALVLGNSCILGLMLAERTKKLYYVESNSLLYQIMTNFISFNRIDNVEIFKSLSALTETAPMNEINFVFAEPYFSSSIFPWDNLLVFHLLYSLREKLASDVHMLPTKCKIKGIAVNFDNLHKIRVPLGKCEDFLMDDFDNMIQHSTDNTITSTEAQPLWEYPGIAVSEVCEIASVTLSNVAEPYFDTKGSFAIVENMGGCNGVAMWVEWYFGVENTIVSCGPIITPSIGERIHWDMYTKQAVCLFKNRQVDFLDYDFNINWEEGTVAFECK